MTDNSSGRHRLVLVGLNHYHVTGWAQSLGWLRDHLDVVAIYDPDPSRADLRSPDFTDPSLSQEFPDWLHEIPFESSLTTLVEAHQPDIALVTLPNDQASAAIATFAEAGVHVLVDKPGARNALEAGHAFGAAQRAGIKVSVALTRRHHPGWKSAAERIRFGDIGELVTTEAILVTSSVDVRDPANHIFSRESMGGGVLHWLGVHELDSLLWLTGQDIVSVQGWDSTVGESSLEVENVFSGSVQYESGAIGTLHFTYAMPRKAAEGYIAVRGTKGSIRILPDGSWTWLGPDDVNQPVYEESRTYTSGLNTGYGSVGVVAINDLVDAIDQDRDPVATGDDALKVLRVIDALYASAATRKRVVVGNTR